MSKFRIWMNDTPFEVLFVWTFFITIAVLSVGGIILEALLKC